MQPVLADEDLQESELYQAVYDQQLVGYMPQDDKLALNVCEERAVTIKQEIEMDNPELIFKKVPTAQNKIQKLRKNQCNVCRKRLRSKGKFERHKKVHIKTTASLQENEGFETEFETLGQTLGVEFEQIEERQTPETSEIKLTKNEPHLQNNNYTGKKENTATGAKKKLRVKKVPCDRCDRKFRNRYDLKKHLKIHSIVEASNKLQGRKFVQCLECKRRFSDSTHLKQHSKIHSNTQTETDGKKTVNQEVNDANKLKNKLQSISMKVQCLECNRLFSDSAHLKQHSKIHSKTETEIGGKKIVLQEVNDANNSKNKLQGLSMKLKKGKPSQCLECKRLFYDIYTLRRHIRRMHSKTPNRQHGKKCVLQEACNTTIPNSKSHSKSNKQKKRKPAQCLECKRWLRDSYDLKQHTSKIHSKAQIEIHGKKVLFQEANDTNELNSDLQDKSEKVQEIGPQCEKCGRTFRSISHFKQHSVVHLENHAKIKGKKSELDLEKTDSINPVNTISNSVVHSETQAKVQDKKTEHELQKAEDINQVNSISKSTSKKKYVPAQCPICKKVFRDKWKLKRHVDSSVHTKVLDNIKKAVACTMCEKSYESKHSLDRHMSAHHKEKMI